MVINARSLAKPDACSALYLELNSHNVDLGIVTETWLKSTIPSQVVCPDGFTVIRKDRPYGRQGGGVAVFCRHDWKLEILEEFSNPYECLWTKITTNNSIFYLSAIYHPPSPEYHPDDLLDFLMDSCERLLSLAPNAKLIIAGDINQLAIKTLLNYHSLVQIVNLPTRGQNILDVFVTNVPNFWSKAKTIKSLVRSDHLAVLLKPVVKAKATRKTVEFRDLREHNKLKMLRKMEDFQWDTISSGTSCPNEMINNFYNKIWPIYEECFPIIKTRVSSRDPPFLSPIVKHLLKLRKNAINKRDNESSHRLQERINKLIRSNQLKAVKQENKNQNCGSKRWWSLVNKITGRGNNEVPLSHIIDPKVMNEHFQSINTDPDYVIPQPLPIPPGTRVPELSVHTVCKLLLNQKRTTSGPDELPHWFWNTYAYDIAPVITIIFNSSIKLGIVPDSWKLANLLPVPKESPLTESNQLRPISLTNIIVRLFERAIYITELVQVMENAIHKDQFAYKRGYSSTMALIKAQHTWMDWLDGNANMVRVFSLDFSKAFDTGTARDFMQ